MKKELEYTELDYNPNVSSPPPPKNAGLYTGDVLFDKKPWGNNYVIPHVNPDAVEFTAQFYASHHIPSYNRPGNNHISTDKYVKYLENQTDDNYNFSCYVNNING